MCLGCLYVAEDYYGRIVDLSRKVLEGEVDPLDIDISTLVKTIGEVDVDRLPLEVFKRDVEALRGLALILSMQKERIRASLEGFRLDSLLVKTVLLSLDVDELAGLITHVYRPPVEISYFDEALLGEALAYFNSIRRFELPPLDREAREVEAEPFIEEDIRREMEALHKRLLDESKGDWLDYWDVVSDDVFKAYLISLLASEGLVDIRVDRIEDRIYIRPLREPRRFVDPVSLPVVIRRGGEEAS